MGASSTCCSVFQSNEPIGIMNLPRALSYSILAASISTSLLNALISFLKLLLMKVVYLLLTTADFIMYSCSSVSSRIIVVRSPLFEMNPSESIMISSFGLQVLL